MKEFTFSGQREGEEINLIVYRHPYLIYPPGFITVILLTLGFTVLLFWPVVYYISLAIFVFALIYFCRAFYAFRESIAILTDQRLFVIDQKGFFSRKIVEVDLDKILDVTTETSGLFRTMLKYGDVVVSTAGAREGGDIEVKNIPNPYYFQQRLANVRPNMFSRSKEN